MRSAVHDQPLPEFNIVDAIESGNAVRQHIFDEALAGRVGEPDQQPDAMNVILHRLWTNMFEGPPH